MKDIIKYDELAKLNGRYVHYVNDVGTVYYGRLEIRNGKVCIRQIETKYVEIEPSRAFKDITYIKGKVLTGMKNRGR